MRSRILLILLLLLVPLSALSQIDSDLFARDAKISGMTMSPDGKTIAYIRRTGDMKVLSIQRVGGEVISAFDAGEDKMRGFRFVSNDHLVLFKSVTTDFRGKKKYEFNAAISLNINTKRSRELLLYTKDLLWPQLHLDRIIGPSKKEGHILMTARTGASQVYATYGLFRVNLDTGKGVLLRAGTGDTIDWFVDSNEVIHAREDFDNRRDRHVVKVPVGKTWKDIFVNEAEIREHGFVGPSKDYQNLVVIGEDPSGNFEAGYHYSISDKKFSPPIFFQKEKEIDHAIKGWSHEVIGVKYAGLNPSYQFYDRKLTSSIDALVKQAAPASVYINTISQDLSKALVLVEGDGQSGHYYIYDTKTGMINHLATKRSDIPEEHIAIASTDMIEARDGLEIPTILTLPRNSDKNLPAIVLPHGGPESYDRLGYDYFAQYFASLGYAVIQPNFRGSTGFGWEHRKQGRGKWGKEMQTDLSDALQHYIDQGVIDKDRVCIVGASYGGYAALAGGAFTPEHYRCVAAISPVSDLPLMLYDQEKKYRSGSWVVTYWERVMGGDRRGQREMLESISPAYHADKYQVPVLLVHGKDDTVVPIKQSSRMYSKLKKAGKDVKFVKLKGEDHRLSTESSRLAALNEIKGFLKENLN